MLKIIKKCNAILNHVASKQHNLTKSVVCNQQFFCVYGQMTKRYFAK